jgi:hypothetical protein
VTARRYGRPAPTLAFAGRRRKIIDPPSTESVAGSPRAFSPNVR